MIALILASFRRSPLQASILFIVLAAHLFFVLMLLISPYLIPRKKEHKPLIVTTITPKPVVTRLTHPQKAPSPMTTPQRPPPKPEVKKETAPPKPAPALQKEKVAAPEKKQPAHPTLTIKKEPAIADKKIGPTKQPAKKTAPPPEPRAKISDSLLRELEESIAKIDGKGDKSPTKRSASAAVKQGTPIQLQIDTLAAAEDESGDDYADVLLGHLHHYLRLPDYGEVKIQLSLRQDGSVARVVVLKSQSEKNRQYLETTLPRLVFPRFEGKYLNRKEHTFALAFCNEL